MSTDDKPLLTEWQTGRTGALFCRRLDEPVHGRIDYARVEVWPESGNAPMWTIFDDNYNCVMHGRAPTEKEAKRAADAAARQWYTLPSPIGQPAAPPEHEGTGDGCDCPSLPCVHRPRGSELSSAYMDEGARIVAARVVRAHPFAPGTVTGTRQAWLREAIACAIEGKQEPPFVEATSPPPVAAASTTRCRMGCGNLATHGPAGEAWACWQHAGDWPMVPSPATPLPAPASEGATAHPQPDAADSTFVAVVHVPPGVLPPVSMTVGGQTVPFEVLEVEGQQEATGADGHSFCPQCGWDVRVDEDGCCAACGSTAMGDAVDAMAADHARLVEAAKALANYLRDNDLDDHTGKYWRRYEALRAALGATIAPAVKP